MPLHFTGIVTRRDMDHPEEAQEPKEVRATPPLPQLELVLKYNPNHGKDGRFTSGSGGGGGADSGVMRGLQKWVTDYKAMRSAGNVKGAKQIQKDIDSHIKQHGLDRAKVYGPDPDNPKNRGGGKAPEMAYRKHAPRASAADIAADKSKWTPGKSFAEHQADKAKQSPRPGPNPHQRVIMGKQHGTMGSPSTDAFGNPMGKAKFAVPAGWPQGRGRSAERAAAAATSAFNPEPGRQASNNAAYRTTDLAGGKDPHFNRGTPAVPDPHFNRGGPAVHDPHFNRGNVPEMGYQPSPLKAAVNAHRKYVGDRYRGTMGSPSSDAFGKTMKPATPKPRKRKNYMFNDDVPIGRR